MVEESGSEITNQDAPFNVDCLRLRSSELVKNKLLGLMSISSLRRLKNAGAVNEVC
jgi:hypothetical protein